ncbi:MAG TPA: single-stranded-DNA-specific exonuclease RecJ [Myxococcaceae bacterium]|nr:single-stranded-DNA-specific exonuclease RecJ [Myxococcaceae bacterium]
MRWVLPESREEAAAALSRELGVHPLCARVLVARGHGTPDAASRYLALRLSDLPDPFLMKGLRAAVDRLARAVAAGEKITLWGDYDVDGVSSTALLSLFLEAIGAARVATYIPHRLGEGYGLNVQAIEKIAADGTRLLVTLDCGITSHAEIARANALGLEVVVVDHHAVPEENPPALAVLNPLQRGCDYPSKYLCAAGVAFNLCVGLRKVLRERGHFQGRAEPNLKAYLDLVALATVADVVPLTGANRILVRHGLDELTAARRPGVAALKEISGLGRGGVVTAGHVGFRLGPRINAAGRLDDASVGLQLLRSTGEAEAMPLARKLESANQERRAIEQAILEQAFEQAEARRGSRGLVLAAEGWHPGVIGIVASRVVERFHRPTVMVALQDGLGRGSGRSIEAFHLYDALKHCAGHLSRFGGHKHAAGLSVEAPQLEAFRAAFEQVALERLTEDDLVPRCRVDAMVGLGELDEKAVAAVQALGPFGAGNPEPVFATRRLTAQPRVIASKKGGPDHLKLRFDAALRLDAIGFGMADRIGVVERPVDLAYQAHLDEWNGERRVSLKLKDLRAAAAA